MKTLKRFVSAVVAIAIMVSACAFAAIVVKAAGTDDGVLSVITKNAQKYFGTTKSEFCIEFISANGNGSKFNRYSEIDVNGDAKSDIADLVALDNAVSQNDGTDLDFDSRVDGNDLEILRKTLIGIADIGF